MIEKVIGKTRTTELDTITSRIYAAYQSASLSSDATLTGIFNTIKPYSENLNQAINRIKSKSELEEKDDVRDNAARSFYYLILGCTHHPDKTIKNAALKVMAVFEMYGLEMVTESYATETSLLNSLLTELDKPDMQAAITLLSGASESIVSMKEKQDDFEATHLKYEQNKAEEGTYTNATEIKKEIITLINHKLVVYLQAMIMVDETIYGELARTVGQIIADSNEVVRKRTKKNN